MDRAARSLRDHLVQSRRKSHEPLERYRALVIPDPFPTYQQGLVEYGQGIEESVHYVQLMKDFSALQASPRRVRELEGKVAEEQKIARP